MTTREAIVDVRFTALNRALAERVYPVTGSGGLVYLDVDGDVIEDALRAAGMTVADPRQDFLKVVRPTLGPIADRAFLIDHKHAVADWRAHGLPSLEPPTCLSALAVLCLAAEDMATSTNYGPNNYFGRLADIVGIGSEENAMRNLQRHFRDNQPELWSALAEWLVKCGNRGLPSARPAGGHRHIGLPLGQVLIRAADRPWLQACFAASGFTPGEAVAEATIEGCLAAWLGRNPPALIVHQAAQAGVRPSLVAAIASEAVHWDGVVPAGAQRAQMGAVVAEPKGAGGRLALQLDLRRGISPRLGVTAVVYAEARPGNVEVLAPPNSGVRLELHDSIQQGEFEIAMAASGEEAAALLELSRVTDDEGRAWLRLPADYLVFEEDLHAMAFVETTTPRLGSPLIILVRESETERLEAALGGATSVPWHRFADGDLENAPPGWVAFGDVTLTGALQGLDGVVARVAPPERAAIRVSGVRVSGGAYLSDTQLSIIVEAPDPFHQVIAVGSEEAADETVVLMGEGAPDGGTTATALDARLHTGRWTIRIIGQGDRVLGQLSFSVAGPEAAFADRRPAHRDLSDTAWANVSAVQGAPEAGVPFMRGAFASVQAPGAGGRAGGRRTFSGVARQRTRADFADDVAAVDFESLLAYISAVESGTYETLQRAARTLGAGSPWAANKAISLLSDLGHIEIVLEPTTCRRREWAVSPAVLVVQETQAFLAGWRSEALIHEVGQWATNRHGPLISSLRRDPQRFGPDRIRLVGLRDADQRLQQAAASLAVPVRLMHSLEDLGNQIPSLATTRRGLPVVPLPQRARIERRSGTGRWSSARQLTTPAAYRWRDRGIYWHWDGSDLRAAPAEVALWLSAHGRDTAKMLVEWDARDRILSFSYHVPPPTLVSRFLTLATGGAAPEFSAGVVSYSGVSDATVEKVLSALEIS